METPWRRPEVAARGLGIHFISFALGERFYVGSKNNSYYLYAENQNATIMSHICNYQHIVFRTYRSRKTIPDIAKMMMIKYVWKLCADHNIFVKNANFHRNHAHLLVSVPSTLSLEQVATLIKSNTSKTFTHHRLFPNFEGWAEKYGSFSVSRSRLDAVSRYIDNQEKHHEGVTFYEEFKRLVEINGGEMNEYFERDFGKLDAEEDLL